MLDFNTFSLSKKIELFKINNPSMHLFSDFEPGAVLHSYKKSFNGFVLKLTEDEAETLAGNY